MMEKTNKANPPRTIIVIATAKGTNAGPLYQIGNFIRHLCTCITSHITYDTLSSWFHNK